MQNGRKGLKPKIYEFIIKLFRKYPANLLVDLIQQMNTNNKPLIFFLPNNIFHKLTFLNYKTLHHLVQKKKHIESLKPFAFVNSIMISDNKIMVHRLKNWKNLHNIIEKTHNKKHAWDWNVKEESIAKRGMTYFFR